MRRAMTRAAGVAALRDGWGRRPRAPRIGAVAFHVPTPKMAERSFF
ncbi:hypothetical protein BURPS305_1242 [Burkholderia pseudomallei 305]|uniref:Uncharacterized protein n=1 Tax=Burkholderia mallei (strain NCTC 10229) TaxID=412022 RepID=A2S3U7_BURM9|nr:hypothetical protein BMA10229_A0621 [Burkholderia mallei NCTC 10229]ABN81830.1 hypothetical protein BURPS668_1445 [Burkholderia pseudomallei 668]ACQ95312.1 conserved hypothetical protein [Burkholderia pseudomallei MSHR346]EBA45854.1 hypothetical protein BURPS305_1242 [Burkholderia pseudomallei 305]EEH25404.1 conserved hypothetical protein [Burkholderia pseudomallei Pakistan 9]